MMMYNFEQQLQQNLIENTSIKSSIKNKIRKSNSLESDSQQQQQQQQQNFNQSQNQLINQKLQYWLNNDQCDTILKFQVNLTQKLKQITKIFELNQNNIEVIQILLKRQYQICSYIASGGFGQVYNGKIQQREYYGTSQIKEGNKDIQIYGYTKKYAPQELIKSEQKKLGYHTDLYSLGKTLQYVIIYFKQRNSSKEGLEFENIIDNFMVQEDIEKRFDCLQIHKMFFNKIAIHKNQEFLNCYAKKIDELFKLQPFDNNKDIQFFQEIQLYYYQTLLQIGQLDETNNSYRDNISNLLFNIGQFLLSQRKHSEAERYFQDSLKIKQELLNSYENPEQKKRISADISSCLDKISWVFLAKADYEKSLKFSFESLKAISIYKVRNIRSQQSICQSL
ncbi:hypothetical protein ABPG72_017880 [Tetrahymena utriculariae]